MNRTNSRTAAGIFLETSAQINRLMPANQEVREDIGLLLASAKAVSTSNFVAAEFEEVIGGLYDAVADAVGSVLQRHRPRPFDELWADAVELLGYRVPGGPKLLSAFVAALARRYSVDLVTPIEVRSFLKGQRSAVLELFYVVQGVDLRANGLVFDRSSCYVWPSTGRANCLSPPCSECGLRHLCITEREQFLSCLSVVVETKAEESKVLKTLEALLKTAEPAVLLQLIGKHPNSFGDTIIFGEVPDDWRILTKDHVFKALADASNRGVEVYFVRPKRQSNPSACMIKRATDSSWSEGKVLNFSSRELLVECQLKLSNRQLVEVDAEPYGDNRIGVVRRVEPKNSLYQYGIRLRPRSE